MRLASVLGLVLAAAPALSQDAARGAVAYATYCATCHGSSAEGNGPMAGLLVVPPTDLTWLASKNGGAFPTARVARRIDGRDMLAAHGGPMPIYGPFFEGSGAAVKAPDGQPVLTSAPVADLIVWLESIQK